MAALAAITSTRDSGTLGRHRPTPAANSSRGARTAAGGQGAAGGGAAATTEPVPAVPASSAAAIPAAKAATAKVRVLRAGVRTDGPPKAGIGLMRAHRPPDE